MTVLHFLHIFTFPTCGVRVPLDTLFCFLLAACWRPLASIWRPLGSDLSLLATLGASWGDLGTLPGRTLGVQVGLFGGLGLQAGLQGLQVGRQGLQIGFLGRFGTSSWASFGPLSWTHGWSFEFRFFDHIYQGGEAECAERLNKYYKNFHIILLPFLSSFC